MWKAMPNAGDHLEGVLWPGLSLSSRLLSKLPETGKGEALLLMVDICNDFVLLFKIYCDEWQQECCRETYKTHIFFLLTYITTTKINWVPHNPQNTSSLVPARTPAHSCLKQDGDELHYFYIPLKAWFSVRILSSSNSINLDTHTVLSAEYLPSI